MRLWHGLHVGRLDKRKGGQVKALRVVIFDRTIGAKTQEFSNPGIPTANLQLDIINRTLTIDGVTKTVLDLAPGDVFELRITEGVEA